MKLLDQHVDAVRRDLSRISRSDAVELAA